MAEIAFISYSGKYPNLCSGELKIAVDNKIYGGIHIISGGRVWFDEGWGDHVEDGPWSVDLDSLPEEIKQYATEIADVVNYNVPHGCCGGCV